jgi:hypothetical protein
LIGVWAVNLHGLLVGELVGSVAWHFCWSPTYCRCGAKGQEREREDGHVERFDELDRNHRPGESEKTATRRDPNCSEQPDKKAGKAEKPRRHGNLDEDVVAVGQCPASQHVLVERKRRARVHRSSELTGAGTQQGVMQQIVRTLQPHSEPKPKGGLGGSRSHARAEAGATTQVGNSVADADEQRERPTATSAVGMYSAYKTSNTRITRANRSNVNSSPTASTRTTAPHRKGDRHALPNTSASPPSRRASRWIGFPRNASACLPSYRLKPAVEDVLDDLEHGNKRTADRANEQPCQEPSTILRAE